MHEAGVGSLAQHTIELREYSKTDQAFRQTGNNVSHDPKLVEKGKKKGGRETRNICMHRCIAGHSGGSLLV